MRIVVYMLLLIAIGLLQGFADDKVEPVEVKNVTITMNVKPNEARNYDLSVQLKGKTISESSAEPIDLNATYTMKMQLKFGMREGDGLLPLDIIASDARATIDGQQFTMPTAEFPRLTLLIDSAWKVNSAFGIARTRYAERSPGLNYANLIMLYLIPDIDKPHALGESRKVKVKLPGFADECSVTTLYKSVETLKGIEVVNVHQDYVWTDRKLDDGVVVDSTASVDSVIAIDGGKLISTHAESKVDFRKSGSDNQKSGVDQAVTTIDIMSLQ